MMPMMFGGFEPPTPAMIEKMKMNREKHLDKMRELYRWIENLDEQDTICLMRMLNAITGAEEGETRLAIATLYIGLVIGRRQQITGFTAVDWDNEDLEDLLTAGGPPDPSDMVAQEPDGADSEDIPEDADDDVPVVAIPIVSMDPTVLFSMFAEFLRTQGIVPPEE
jgi:hypothetical protein